MKAKLDKIKTFDNSTTFYSHEFKEPYHSITSGAFSESLTKFYNPCKPEKKGEGIKLLDIGFGLGYNCAVFIERILKEFTGPIYILSIDRSIHAFKESIKLDWQQYNKEKPVLKNLLKNKCSFFGFPSMTYAGKRIRIRLVIGDIRKVLKEIYPYFKKAFDMVFHDPFSPNSNPEMWTVELFKIIKHMTSINGKICTYSSSSIARKSMISAGLKIALGVKHGRKSRSTIAGEKLKEELPPDLIKKLESEIPFRDPKLNDKPDVILSRRRGCIYIINKLNLHAYHSYSELISQIHC